MWDVTSLPESNICSIFFFRPAICHDGTQGGSFCNSKKFHYTLDTENSRYSPKSWDCAATNRWHHGVPDTKSVKVKPNYSHAHATGYDKYYSLFYMPFVPR